MIVNTEKAPAAIGPYSQAIAVGNMLFTSGQLGLNPGTGTLPEGIALQTEQALANLEAILTEAGFQLSDVVKVTVFIASMSDFPTVNAIYESFFGSHKPARSCIEVAALPKAGLVEIEAVAVKEATGA